jgi:cation/acetate symporter
VTLSVIAIVGVVGAALGIGTYGVRLARTTSDLFVASRAVSPWWNAAAISGEYLSAASFLGVAGLMLKFGASALWLPVGFTAGYLTLLLFVAAPLRRFGSYTIPDFAEARLPAPSMRLLAAAIVLLISGCYLVPQLKGAGVTLRAVTGAPYWVGVAVVAGIVALNVVLGGMRGVTYVQAFQYWVKVFAIALPAIVLMIHLGGLPARAALFGSELPRTGEKGLVVELDRPRTLTFPDTGETRTVPAGDLRIPPGTAVPVAARERVRPRLAAADLLAAAGHLPRDDGPAAHPRPLLHQPGRLGGAQDHRARARAARRLLPLPGRLRPARARLHAGALRHRGH